MPIEPKIYIKDDYTLDSDSVEPKLNKEKNNFIYGFDKLTPRLTYSNTLSSFSNKNYIDTSHSIPSRLEDKILPPILNSDQSSIVFLDASSNKFPKERPYNTHTHLNTGRSSTCNVTIPCEFEKNSNQEFSKNTHLNHNKSIGIKKQESYLHKTSQTVKNTKKTKHTIDLESQQSTERMADTDSILTKFSRDMLLAPEFASDDRTRRFLYLFREIYVGIIGCQFVYVLTTLLFGNAALAIIVTLLLIQSCFCHADGRPMGYFVNALLSLAIGITVIVALAKDISGLEPFRTEPVLKTLSIVYIPVCFIFTLLSVLLALGFRKLHKSEKKAIVKAANNLLGKEYFVDRKSLLISKRSSM